MKNFWITTTVTCGLIRKTGLVYVNHFRWNKAISRNLMLELFEILKPIELSTKKKSAKANFISKEDIKFPSRYAYEDLESI